VANNRMYLVNPTTGQRILLAKHFAAEWRATPDIEVTPGLLQSMRDQIPAFVEDYQPRRHDVRLVQRIPDDLASYKLADTTSASCTCGWKVGPIYGESREHVLELAVSAHVNDD
jgi:hypothetical protein